MFHTKLMDMTSGDLIGVYFVIQLLGFVVSLVFGFVIAAVKALFF